MLDLCSGGRHCLHYTGQKVYLPFALKRRYYLCYQDNFLYEHSRKDRVERIDSQCLETGHSRSIYRLPWRLNGRESSCQYRRHGFYPWVEKIPGQGNGNSLQYPLWENPMDRGNRWAKSMGLQMSQT